MITAMTVPQVGESIQEVEIAQWLKREGDSVEKDEEIVEVDSEKASLQIPSPSAGRIVKIFKQRGESAQVGEVIAEIDDAAAPSGDGGSAELSPKEATKPAETKPVESKPVESKPAESKPAETQLTKAQAEAKPPAPREPAPASKAEKKEEKRQLEKRDAEKKPAPRPPQGQRGEEVVPMSMIRRRIAERLVEAQKNAALLTTFNEIDMSAVIELRKSLRETFQERFSVKLGFMSFFVKAAIEALKRFPEVNAEIRDESIVYHRYFDIGIAIGGGKGLVVPVLRDADQLSFGEVELAIEDFAKRAAAKKLLPEELTGGTFTISNGGVYGSLLSTPIINPPQSGVLGMHTIQERPVARDGVVVIRPMMYVALTYDHRIVDGREAVGFLKRVKELVEQPSRILLEV